MMNLFEAARSNDYQTVVSFIRVFGNSANERDDDGLTCLHIAATLGHFETAQMLLEHGADVSIPDRESGWTPLHRAVYFGHVKIVLLLISFGALMEFAEDAAGGGGGGSSGAKGATACAVDKEGLTPMDLLTYRLHQLKEAFKTSRFAEFAALGLSPPTFHRAGAVFTFGKADVRLGIQLPKASDILRPRRVDAFDDVSIAHICAGKHHCLATSDDGRVFSWGHGRGGKLGHDIDEGMLPVPTLIKSLCAEKIQKIALSDHHSMALTAQGTLYTWGSNRFGQLGHADLDTTRHLSCPRRLDSFKRDVILGMASGEHHCICFTENGEVYTWGSNRHGQLGLKLGEVSTTPQGPGNTMPKRVTFPVKLNGVHTMVSRQETVALVVDVVAAYQSTLVLVKVRSPSTTMTSSSASSSSSTVVYHKYQPRLPHGFTTEVYQWGDGVPQPRRVTFPSSKGASSSKRTKSVDWSDGSDGVHDNDQAQQQRGQVLQHFCEFGWTEHSQLVQVCAGRHHFVALSTDGVVYSWGVHADALGLSDRPPTTTATATASYATSAPQVVEALLPDRLVVEAAASVSAASSASSMGGGAAAAAAAAAGAAHGFTCSRVVYLAAAGERTAAVTDRGEVFTWGAAPHRGVLSPDGARSCALLPRRMAGMKRVERVALAEDYTMLVVNVAVPRAQLLPFTGDAAPATATADGGAAAAEDEDANDEDNEDDNEDDNDDSGSDDSDGDFDDWRRTDTRDHRRGDRQRHRRRPAAASSAAAEDTPPTAITTTTPLSLRPTQPWSLHDLCQFVACQAISMKNVLPAMSFGDVYHARLVRQWCLLFMTRNLDALLAYTKPSDIERAVHDWKLPALSAAWTPPPPSSTMRATRPSATATSSSLAVAVASSRNSSATSLASSASTSSTTLTATAVATAVSRSDAPPSEAAVVWVDYSQPEVLTRAMRGKHTELQAIATVQEMQKLMRSTKKRLAAIQELTDRVRDKGYVLSREQEEKVHRKLLLQAEYALMEQFLVRLTVREQKQQPPPSQTTPQTTPQPPQTTTPQTTKPTKATPPAASSAKPPSLTAAATAAAAAEGQSARGGGGGVSLSSAAGNGRTVLSPPSTPASPLPSATTVTPKKTAAKAKYVPFAFHDATPTRPTATPTATAVTPTAPSSSGKGGSVWGAKAVASPSPVPTATAAAAAVAVAATTPTVTTPTSSSAAAGAAAKSPAALQKTPSSTPLVPAKPTAEAAAGPVSFGTAFNFEAALAAKRQSKKAASLSTATDTAAHTASSPATVSSAPKSAWGTPPPASTAVAAASPAATIAGGGGGGATVAARSLADIVAEEESARIQAQYYASMYAPIASGTTYVPHSTGGGTGIGSHAGQDHAWYIAKKTVALPLSHVIAQQTEEQEIAMQLQRFEELERLEKRQQQQQQQQQQQKGGGRERTQSGAAKKDKDKRRPPAAVLSPTAAAVAAAVDASAAVAAAAASPSTPGQPVSRKAARDRSQPAARTDAAAATDGGPPHPPASATKRPRPPATGATANASGAR